MREGNGSTWNDQRRQRRGRAGAAAVVGALVGLGLGVLVGALVFRDENEEATPRVMSPTLQGIIDEPRKFIGEREGDPAIRATAVTFLSGSTPVVETRGAEEIAERARDFYGTIAAVEGQVTDVRDSAALVLEDQLLVLTADIGQRRPEEGDRVRIVGPVRPFDPDQRQPEARPLPEDEIFGEFANRPVVVAQSIEIEP